MCGTEHVSQAWLGVRHTSRGAELDDVQLGGEVAVLEGLLRKGDDRGGAIPAGHLDGGERRSVRLQGLAALLLQRV